MPPCVRSRTDTATNAVHARTDTDNAHESNDFQHSNAGWTCCFDYIKQLDELRHNFRTSRTATETPDLNQTRRLMDPKALRTVLYVDDEPDIREIVQLALGLEQSLTVHTGESGEHGLELARQLQPDLLVLDVMMPGLDGPATLKRMREDPAIAHIPVIFMTAKAMPREVALFRSMGAVGVIGKPFDPMQLSKQVLSLWKDHLTEVLARG
jgi:two-component system, OmpR family, response regulator